MTPDLGVLAKNSFSLRSTPQDMAVEFLGQIIPICSSLVPRRLSLMKMCAQRKAGRTQRARRLADLVFKMAARAMADEYAVFKISSALFILRILSKSLPIHVVCMKRKLFSPHTLDSSIIMFTTELHNVILPNFNAKHY